MGEEAYEKQVEEEKKIFKIRDELQEQMEGMGRKEQGEFVISLKEQGAKLREKLQALGQEKAVEYINDRKLKH